MTFNMKGYLAWIKIYKWGNSDIAHLVRHGKVSKQGIYRKVLFLTEVYGVSQWRESFLG